MPVDKPKKGETQDKYLAYCIPEEINNGMEQDQAVAVCISKYEQGNTNLSTNERVTLKMNGIRLYNELTKDVKDISEKE
jgi:hypothetical protein